MAAPEPPGDVVPPPAPLELVPPLEVGVGVAVGPVGVGLVALGLVGVGPLGVGPLGVGLVGVGLVRVGVGEGFTGGVVGLGVGVTLGAGIAIGTANVEETLSAYLFCAGT